MKDLQNNIIFWQKKNKLNSDAEQKLIFQDFFKNNQRLMSPSLANDCSKTKFYLKKWKICKKTSFFEKKKTSLIQMQNKNWFFKIFSKITNAWCHQVWRSNTIMWEYFVIFFEPNSQDWPKKKFHLKKWKIYKKTSFFDKNKNKLNSDAEQKLIFQDFFKNNKRLMSPSLANDYNHLKVFCPQFWAKFPGLL